MRCIRAYAIRPYTNVRPAPNPLHLLFKSAGWPALSRRHNEADAAETHFAQPYVSKWNWN
ncbi:MAG: hypothetical protein DLM69_04770 [Candidatus Chloroheliales bacterium]|nr:MAG: hypothetical protein DLM69_04770 [Chloroflexota bacterium]